MPEIELRFFVTQPVNLSLNQLSYPWPINTPSYFTKHQQAWKDAICSVTHTVGALMHLSILNSHSVARTFLEVVSIVTVRLVTIVTNMHMLPTVTMITRFHSTLVWLPPQNFVSPPRCNYKSQTIKKTKNLKLPSLAQSALQIESKSV